MQQVILCKLGEIVLKGLNRRQFEQQLIANTKRRLKHLGEFSYDCRQSCLYITPLVDCDLDAVMLVVGRIFGIVAYGPAIGIDKDMTALQHRAPDYLRQALVGRKTFKVEAKRADKRFPLTSPQIAAELGGSLLEAFPHLTVDVHAPEVTVMVEVREQYIYLHGGTHTGAGGLPVGSSGKGTLLISGGIDSPVAGYLMARRGLELHAVHFESYPYTSQQALQKVHDLCSLVAGYAGRIMLDVVSFTALQERLRERCDEAYFTLLMRRSMMRIAERLARQNKSSCLITGEALGQVASQTIGALGVTNDAITSNFPVLRPCIGMDKEEIIAIARKINTFETSILPYDDCCTIFTPKHPRTRPNYEEVLTNEMKSNLAVLESDIQVERSVITWQI